MHAFVGWVCGLVTVALVASFFGGTWEYAKCWESRFDPQHVADNNLKRNFKKGRQQQTVVFLLALPWGLLLIGAMVWFWFFSFTAWTYIGIAATRLLLAPLFQMWTIAVAVHLRHRLAAKDLLHSEMPHPAAGPDLWSAMTVRGAIRLYYRRGLARPVNTAKALQAELTKMQSGQTAQQSAGKSVGYFKGRLAFLNKWRRLEGLALWLGHIGKALVRYCGPFLLMALMWTFWLVTGLVTIYVQADRVTDIEEALDAWWRFDRDQGAPVPLF